MDDDARMKLRESLKTFGLVDRPIWNEQTGNIVGGNHRLEVLDELKGSLDYELPVTKVNIDLKTEKELNVALNNPAMQGYYDVGILDAMIQAGEIDYGRAGFDEIDLEGLYADAGMDFGYLAEMSSPEGQAEIDTVAGAIDQTLQESDDQVAALKERRKQYQEQANGRNDTEFYVTVVFVDSVEKGEFMELVGLPPAERLVNGPFLAEVIAMGGSVKRRVNAAKKKTGKPVAAK